MTEQSDMYNEVFRRVLNDFECNKLTSRGKGDIPYIVTNPIQAYAIAKNMAERAEKRYVQSLTVVDNVLESGPPAAVAQH